MDALTWKFTDWPSDTVVALSAATERKPELEMAAPLIVIVVPV